MGAQSGATRPIRGEGHVGYWTTRLFADLSPSAVAEPSQVGVSFLSLNSYLRGPQVLAPPHASKGNRYTKGTLKNDPWCFSRGAAGDVSRPASRIPREMDKNQGPFPPRLHPCFSSRGAPFLLYFFCAAFFPPPPFIFFLSLLSLPCALDESSVRGLNQVEMVQRSTRSTARFSYGRDWRVLLSSSHAKVDASEGTDRATSDMALCGLHLPSSTRGRAHTAVTPSTGWFYLLARERRSRSLHEGATHHRVPV